MICKPRFLALVGLAVSGVNAGPLCKPASASRTLLPSSQSSTTISSPTADLGSGTTSTTLTVSQSSTAIATSSTESPATITATTVSSSTQPSITQSTTSVTSTTDSTTTPPTSTESATSTESTTTTSTTTSAASAGNTGMAVFYMPGDHDSTECASAGVVAGQGAALSTRFFASSDCGRQIHIQSSKGEVTVTITNQCDTCGDAYDLDLPVAVFEAVGDISAGQVEVVWEYVS